MPNKCLVSVVMAVRNGQSSVALAIESILRQSLSDFEFIIVDDASADATAEIVRRYSDERIILINNEKPLGLPSSLNKAIQIARGKYIARMDADDIAFSERLRVQYDYLEANKSCDLVACRTLVFGAGYVPMRVEGRAGGHEEICAYFWNGIPMAHPTWFGRASWFRRNPYNECFYKAQDAELLLRTMRSSKFACLPDVLLGYRRERESLAKRLQSRYFFARAFFCNRRNLGLFYAFFSIYWQVAKIFWDVWLSFGGRAKRGGAINRGLEAEWNDLLCGCRIKD